MDELKSIKSEKGKEILVDKENYRYHRHKSNVDGSKVYWRCIVRSCKARLHSDADFNILITIGSHSHSATAAEIRANVAISRVKHRSISSESQSRTIIAEEIRTLTGCGLAELPRIPYISRNIRRWRHVERMHPPIPGSNVGFDIPSEYSCMENGEKFLRFDSGIGDPKRILIFSTDEGLQSLKNCKQWAADGTFKSCPSIFYQLYILHVQIGYFSAPRLFALLSDKSHASYEKLFNEVRNLVNNDGPENVTFDFEKAAHNSFLQTFPNTRLSFCLFHLGQNVYKHIIKEGFKVRYHDDDSFSLKIRCFVALAFLPIDDVVDGFEELADDDDIPQSLVSYFENTYIGPIRGRGSSKRRLEPTFLIASWNVFHQCLHGRPRTNNNLEGFHYALNQSFTCHPTIWKLINVLKREEGLANAKLQKLQQGEQVVQRKKYANRNKHVLNLIENYDCANKLQYLKNIALSIKL